MRAENSPNGRSGINVAAAIGDVWYVLFRAAIDNAPRTLAAAQDAVFERYLPMARTLADGASRDRPVDRAEAEQAAELGLAQAVLGWRRPDSGGFEVVARTAITSQLRRLPAATHGDLFGHRIPGRRTTIDDEQV